MVDPYEGSIVGSGTRIQAGIPTRMVNSERKANGLLLRGVVTATYVSDESGHPMNDYLGDSLREPIAVYCDVLVYPSIPGQRWFGFHNVLVSQPVGGMHRGHIWKPRASTIDLSKKPLEDQTSNPADQDGDHVLIGFLNDSFDQPIILRGLPHPAMDTGHENNSLLGRRMKLTVVDGDPSIIKHHGTFYGVDTEGNFLLDSTWANDGKLQDDPRLGYEKDPPTDGKGTVHFRLPQDANFDLVLYDMSIPAAPNEVMKFSLDKNELHLQITQGETLAIQEDGADATLVLGNGAVPVAVASRLETFYNAVKASLEAFNSMLTGHTHGGVTAGGGMSGPPSTSLSLSSWDSRINSDKLTIPDTAP